MYSFIFTDMVEIFILKDIADMSVYDIEVIYYKSGFVDGPPEGNAAKFPAVTHTAGTYIYILFSRVNFQDFESFLGFSPDYTFDVYFGGGTGVQMRENGVLADILQEDLDDNWVKRYVSCSRHKKTFANK